MVTQKMVFRASVAGVWKRPCSSATRRIAAWAHNVSRRDPVRAMAAPAIEEPALERKVPLTGGVTCSLCGIGRGMQAVTPRTRATMQQAVTPKGGTFIWAYRRSRPNGSRLSCGALENGPKVSVRQAVPARAQQAAPRRAITARQRHRTTDAQARS